MCAPQRLHPSCLEACASRADYTKWCTCTKVCMLSFGPCTSVHKSCTRLCHSFAVCVCVCVCVCCRVASSQPRVRKLVLLAAKQARSILPFYELQLARRCGRVCGWFLVLVDCSAPEGRHSWPVVSQWPLSAEEYDPRLYSRVKRVEVCDTRFARFTSPQRALPLISLHEAKHACKRMLNRAARTRVTIALYRVHSTRHGLHTTPTWSHSGKSCRSCARRQLAQPQKRSLLNLARRRS